MNYLNYCTFFDRVFFINISGKVGEKTTRFKHIIMSNTLAQTGIEKD